MKYSNAMKGVGVSVILLLISVVIDLKYELPSVILLLVGYYIGILYIGIANSDKK